MKRLPGLRIHQLRESTPQKEAEAVESLIKNGEILIALTEEGESFGSVQLAHKLQEFGSKNIIFFVGGSQGIHPPLKKSANILLSLSSLTFPHEVALLILIEQIYRAQSITQGSPYHRQ